MDNIIIAVLGTLTLSFAIAYLSVLHRLSKLTQDFAKLFISHESLQNFVKKTKFESKSDEDIHKENFIKFLSDSRDWAFGYIEDVQKGLEKFISYAEELKGILDEAGITGTIDNRDEKIGRKIRDSEVRKVPFMLIVGEKEQEEGKVAVRKHGQGDLGVFSSEEFIQYFKGIISESLAKE